MRNHPFVQNCRGHCSAQVFRLKTEVRPLSIAIRLKFHLIRMTANDQPSTFSLSARVIIIVEHFRARCSNKKDKKQNHEDALRGRVTVHVNKQMAWFLSVTSSLRLSWPSWPGLSLLACWSSPPSGQYGYMHEASMNILKKNDGDRMTAGKRLKYTGGARPPAGPPLWGHSKKLLFLFGGLLLGCFLLCSFLFCRHYMSTPFRRTASKCGVILKQAVVCRSAVTSANTFP